MGSVCVCVRKKETPETEKDEIETGRQRETEANTERKAEKKETKINR